MRVSELAPAPHELRKKFWLETLALPLEWCELSPEEKSDPVRLLANQELDGVLVSPSFSAAIFNEAKKKPAEVVEAGMIDSLLREQKNLWLRCYVRHALRELIFQRASHLDTHAFVYVTGSGALSRMVAVVAIQMGFRRLIVIAKNKEAAGETFTNLQKLFFDLEVTILSESDLTLQPSNGSLLLNTLGIANDEISFDEILYFNFLKKGGLIVDLCSVDEGPGTNALLAEAINVKMDILTGFDIWSLRDFFFLQTLLKSQFKISKDEYLKRWRQAVPAEIET